MRRHGVVRLVFGAVGVATLVTGGRALWRSHTLADQRAAVVHALEATPGLVVLATDERAGVLRIRGLADPAARPPAEIAASIATARALAGLTLEFVPFEASGVEFVEARLRRRLVPPTGVELHVDGAGVARFSGEASAAWIERARAVAPGVLGVLSVDLSGLVDLDQRDVVRLAAELDGHVVRFPLGRADLGGARELADPSVGAAAAVAGIDRLARAAARAGVLVRVELEAVRHVHEQPGLGLPLSRLAFVRAMLSQGPGELLLFELRPVTHATLESADSGAVRLALAVLGRASDPLPAPAGTGQE